MTTMIKFWNVPVKWALLLASLAVTISLSATRGNAAPSFQESPYDSMTLEEFRKLLNNPDTNPYRIPDRALSATLHKHIEGLLQESYYEDVVALILDKEIPYNRRQDIAFSLGQFLDSSDPAILAVKQAIHGLVRQLEQAKLPDSISGEEAQFWFQGNIILMSLLRGLSGPLLYEEFQTQPVNFGEVLSPDFLSIVASPVVVDMDPNFAPRDSSKLLRIGSSNFLAFQFLGTHLSDISASHREAFIKQLLSRLSSLPNPQDYKTQYALLLIIQSVRDPQSLKLLMSHSLSMPALQSPLTPTERFQKVRRAIYQATGHLLTYGPILRKEQKSAGELDSRNVALLRSILSQGDPESIDYIAPVIISYADYFSKDDSNDLGKALFYYLTKSELEAPVPDGPLAYAVLVKDAQEVLKLRASFEEPSGLQTLNDALSVAKALKLISSPSSSDEEIIQSAAVIEKLDRLARGVLPTIDVRIVKLSENPQAHEHAINALIHVVGAARSLEAKEILEKLTSMPYSERLKQNLQNLLAEYSAGEMPRYPSTFQDARSRLRMPPAAPQGNHGNPKER